MTERRDICNGATVVEHRLPHCTDFTMTSSVYPFIGVSSFWPTVLINGGNGISMVFRFAAQHSSGFLKAVQLFPPPPTHIEKLCNNCLYCKRSNLGDSLSLWWDYCACLRVVSTICRCPGGGSGDFGNDLFPPLTHTHTHHKGREWGREKLTRKAYKRKKVVIVGGTDVTGITLGNQQARQQ